MVETPVLTLALVSVSAIATYCLTLAVQETAILCGAVDWPGPRKIHRTPMPRWGGLAVAVPVSGALIYTDWRLLGATLIIVSVGALDDRRPMPWWSKLCVQCTAAAIILPGNMPWLVLLWIVGMTNAWNLMDGVDGLASGLGVIGAGAGAIFLGGAALGIPLWVLTGSLLGFLVLNWHPARIFLGDSGAYLIGFLIAASTVTLPWPQRLAICFVPLADVSLAVLRRGCHWARPDQAHLHHRLLASGLSQRGVCWVLWGIALLWVWGSIP